MNFNYNTYIRSHIFKSFFKENSDSIFLNSSFCFKNSYISEKFFKFCNFYNIYSRFSNPTNLILEKKISFFENFKYSLSFSSGMAALFSIFINFFTPFEYFCSSINLFNSTINFFLNFISKFNIFVIFLNFLNLNYMYYNIFFIKLFFLETPSNPTLKLYDVNLISYLCVKYNLLFFIDSTISPPPIQYFSIFKVDFLLHSCTKFLDGGGNVLGGVLLTNNYVLFLNTFSFLRFSGLNISPFNSWLIFKNLNTLFIRIKNQIFNSNLFLKIFKYNFFILKIFFSGLLNYNNYKIFFFQQIISNSLFSFIIKGNTFEMQRVNSWKLLNNNYYISNTSNFGDVLSIITSCSITTHHSLNFIEKLTLNIYDSFLRISFGIEDVFDLYYSLIISFNNF